MTTDGLQKVRQQEFDRAKKLLMDRNDELTQEIWFMLLAIPTNVLIADYWPKTARQRITEFVEKCMGFYRAWEQGAVDMTQMQELTEEYAGVKQQIAIIKKASAGGWKSFYKLKKESPKSNTGGKGRGFNNFSERNYDMQELERRLIN